MSNWGGKKLPEKLTKTQEAQLKQQGKLHHCSETGQLT